MCNYIQILDNAEFSQAQKLLSFLANMMPSEARVQIF